jgi:AraC-like DNA-binding protein
MVVASELENLGVSYKNLVLGEVETIDSFSGEQFEKLDKALRSYGLELIADKRAQLIEKIKNTIIEIIHYSEEELKINFSDYLSEHLNYDYTYLSNLFSEVTGISIEKYFIAKKIEHVKELLINEKLNLKEISYLTNYSSVAHLSYQFKKMTGFAPSEFRTMVSRNEMSLQEAY